MDFCYNIENFRKIKLVNYTFMLDESILYIFFSITLQEAKEIHPIMFQFFNKQVISLLVQHCYLRLNEISCMMKNQKYSWMNFSSFMQSNWRRKIYNKDSTNINVKLTSIIFLKFSILDCINWYQNKTMSRWDKSRYWIYLTIY